MKAAALVLLIRVLALLPLWLARSLGAALGHWCWFTGSRMARTTTTNLRLCFPNLEEKERNKLGRDSLVQTFVTAAEAGAVWLWPPALALQLVKRVEGLELLQAACAAGNGVLVLSPHVGNWELLGLYLNTCGCGQSSQLYLAREDPALDALMYKARSRTGAHMVATDNKGVAILLQALRRGEIVGILPDQVPPQGSGEFAPFFGVQALTMTLVSRLQQKTGARVVVGSALRNAGRDGGFTIVFSLPDEQIYAEHMPNALVGLNKSLESSIVAAPTQYQWGYKRFRRQPEGSPRPY